MSSGKQSKSQSRKTRKQSSRFWLQRQDKDPYVQQARQAGYRARSAFKLKELDEKLKLVKPGDVVVDLGAAPGAWCQVAAEKGAARIIALDLLAIEPLENVEVLQMDFMEDDAPETLKTLLDGNADCVLSDMAPNTTGHKGTDHLRIMALVEAAYDFACAVLKPGGHFVAKVFEGGTEKTLLDQMKADFKTVRHVKPPSSRKESAEIYVAATGFKGG